MDRVASLQSGGATTWHRITTATVTKPVRGMLLRSRPSSGIQGRRTPSTMAGCSAPVKRGIAGTRRHRRNGLGRHHQAVDRLYPWHEQKPRQPRSQHLGSHADRRRQYRRSSFRRFIHCSSAIHKGRGTVSDYDVAYGQKGDDAVTKIRRASLGSPCSGLAADDVSRETCDTPAHRFVESALPGQCEATSLGNQSKMRQ